MTTLEFMERELSKNVLNLVRQENRNAPAPDIENIKRKIQYYTEVCVLLRKERHNETSEKHCK